MGTIGDNLRTDYTAIGDTTNLAARLQQHADPGTILISEATYRLVRDDIGVDRRDQRPSPSPHMQSSLQFGGGLLYEE